ncbi:hypothetical protein FEZ63_23820 [Microvirga brassicacearum]|uniref:Flagellar hook-length control protein-like C-terminal domain-containing protein n=1 Tax=Microvirga brassicacearum TaxID=2580413 RepID=A0A5N3P3V8_9HYPH|nr:hypothetical protein FEZ63_23820 [Microvirga brassicacearum]
MSKLDMMLQNVVRRTDSQSAASSSSNGPDAEVGAATRDTFGAVLSGLSGKDQGGDGSTHGPGATHAFGGRGGPQEAAITVETSEGSSTESLTLQAPEQSGTDRLVGELLKAVLVDNGAGPNQSQPVPAASSATQTVLSELLPQIADRASGIQNQTSGTTNVTTVRSGIQLPGLMPDQERALNSSGAALNVIVRHQEAHFRPIVEGFTTKPVSENMNLNTGPSVAEGGSDEAFASVVSRGDAKQINTAEPLDIGLELSRSDAVSPKASASPPEARFIQSAANPPGHAMESSAKAEAAAKSDGPPSLAPAMLERIAGAIVDEAKPVASSLGRSLPADGVAFVATARASEAVVRLLNIQLHPADLGLVTIKLKLSGDNLQMDVQVSNEETARMLKHDSERLTTLLRASGYRTEAINIHSGQTESVQLDPVQSQRQQSLGQSQQEAFQQGASQQGRPQRGEERHENDRKDDSGEMAGERSSINRSADGVYL